jgi:hypothetical protein
MDVVKRVRFAGIKAKVEGIVLGRLLKLLFGWRWKSSKSSEWARRIGTMVVEAKSMLLYMVIDGTMRVVEK